MGKHRGRHKIPTRYVEGIAIRETRPGYHVVDFMVDGRRIRRGFTELSAAETYCRAKRLEIRNQGTRALSFDDRLRRDALAALRILKPIGVSLTDAATEYARRHPATATETFRQACDRYLLWMRDNGRRELSIKEKTWKLDRLCREGLESMPMAAVDAIEVEKIIKAGVYTQNAARDHLRAAKTIMAFYRGENRQGRRSDEKPPETWKPGTVAAVMAAAESDVPKIVPALAVLFFAGIRPDEMKRMTWDAVNLTSGEIYLSGDITKTRTIRHVEISDNLKSWLLAYRGAGKLVPSDTRYRTMREKVMKLAAIDSWPVDVARHTYATMLYRLTGDVNKVMAQLGHFGNAETFVRHYKGVPATANEAKVYFRITPDAAKAKHQFKVAKTA